MPAAVAAPVPPSAQGCIEMVPDAAGFLRPEVDLEAVSAAVDATPCAPRLGDGLKTPRHPFTGRSRAIGTRGSRPRPAASSRCWLMRCSVTGEWSSGRRGPPALKPFVTSWSKRTQPRLDHALQVRPELRWARGIRGCARLPPRRQEGAVRRHGVPGRGDARVPGEDRGFRGFLAVDVICHGTPSPLLWERWAEHKERAAHTALRAVNMRSKTTGWLSYSASYAYAYDAEKDGASASPAPEPDSCVFGKDWYMKAFLANACLRPSCYACGEALVRVGHHVGRLLGHPVSAPRGRLRGRRVRRHLQHAEGRGRVRGGGSLRRERRVLPREGLARKPEPDFACRPLREARRVHARP